MAAPPDPALNRLRQGIRRFQKEVYPQHRENYQVAASTPQKPHTLMITCSDSRIDVETILGSDAGEIGKIFTARNVGNLVPAYGETTGGVSAVIEYAVNALKVQHIVVCGHMDCGAMKALKANDSTLDALPSVKNWLHNAAEARSAAESMGSADGNGMTLRSLTEQNVLLQLTNLQTHPAVSDALARGELTISGWIYDIASGDVFIHDAQTKQFESTLASDTQTVQDTAAVKAAEETPA